MNDTIHIYIYKLEKHIFHTGFYISRIGSNFIIFIILNIEFNESGFVTR